LAQLVAPLCVLPLLLLRLAACMQLQQGTDSIS
jgi:hypothetical protein